MNVNVNPNFANELEPFLWDALARGDFERAFEVAREITLKTGFVWYFEYIWENLSARGQFELLRKLLEKFESIAGEFAKVVEEDVLKCYLAKWYLFVGDLEESLDILRCIRETRGLAYEVAEEIAKRYLIAGNVRLAWYAYFFPRFTIILTCRCYRSDFFRLLDLALLLEFDEMLSSIVKSCKDFDFAYRVFKRMSNVNRKLEAISDLVGLLMPEDFVDSLERSDDPDLRDYAYGLIEVLEKTKDELELPVKLFVEGYVGFVYAILRDYERAYEVLKGVERQLNEWLVFVASYDSSLDIVYGVLVEGYCKMGYYDDALRVVNLSRSSSVCRVAFEYVIDGVSDFEFEECLDEVNEAVLCSVLRDLFEYCVEKRDYRKIQVIFNKMCQLVPFVEEVGNYLKERWSYVVGIDYDRFEDLKDWLYVLIKYDFKEHYAMLLELISDPEIKVDVLCDVAVKCARYCCDLNVVEWLLNCAESILLTECENSELLRRVKSLKEWLCGEVASG